MVVVNRRGRSSFSLPNAAAAVCISLVLAGANAYGQQQIYKWQDENGKWHFSDKLPEDERQAELMDESSKATKAPSKDLKAELYAKYAPKSPVEEATLAVVTIYTPLGHGSGFFISKDGFIVTNKHVVRPENVGALKRADVELAESDAKMERAKAMMDRQRRGLKALKPNMEQAKQILKWAKDGQTSAQIASAQAQYDFYKRRYEGYKKIYYKNKRAFDKQAREYRIAKTDLSMKRHATAMATNFKLTLKDGTEVRARLVSLSQDKDLALLKVDGYATPALIVGDPKTLTQGATVYAVGSPLGISDMLTSGIVTRIAKDFIIIDTQIHSGSSGGPLISESGQVVGINTIKVFDYQTTGSFGVAITIDVVSREFKGNLE